MLLSGDGYVMQVYHRVVVSWIVLAIGMSVITGRVDAVKLDSLVDDETGYVPRPETKVFAPRLKSLWLQALRRPEVDLQRQALQAIAAAHRRGMTDLEETIPQIVETLDSDTLHPAVAFDAARTLIELDARSTAATLMELAQRSGLSVALCIEPTLAQWDFQPMRDLWLSRIEQLRVGQKDFSRSLLVMAIQALSDVDEPRAIEPLLEIALDSGVAVDFRIKSARAAGQIQQEGFENDVEKILKSPRNSKLVNRIVAAHLLRHHQGEAAEKLLLKLAVDLSGAVGAIALTRISELDPSLIVPINQKLTLSHDANVRRLTADLLARQNTSEAVRVLAPLLDDPIPDIRIFVADCLVELDQNESLRSTVREVVSEMLHTDKPLGIEQAAMVVGSVDHEPEADRLVELLEAKEYPVGLAAAWALRKISVQKTGDPIFEKICRETEKTIVLDAELWKTWNNNPSPTVDFTGLAATYKQLNQLLQTLANLKYEASADYLKKFLPTPPTRGLGDPPAVAATFTVSCRASAIWTLSRVTAENARPELISTFIEFVQRATPNTPVEPATTRAAAAVSLAYLNAQEAIPVLRGYLHELAAHDAVGASCGRALQQLANDPLPQPVPMTIHQLGWFIEPLVTKKE